MASVYPAQITRVHAQPRSVRRFQLHLDRLINAWNTREFPIILDHFLVDRTIHNGKVKAQNMVSNTVCTTSSQKSRFFPRCIFEIKGKIVDSLESSMGCWWRYFAMRNRDHNVTKEGIILRQNMSSIDRENGAVCTTRRPNRSKQCYT